jgi:hypothetical protein
LQGLGRSPQSDIHQLGYHFLGLFFGGFLTLLSLNGLERRGIFRGKLLGKLG